jgi:two-component system, OmpR family, phosphate regulon response regulator OmpR
VRALILDDEPSIGRVLCRLAKAAGFAAQAATDIGTFQAEYHRALPDVVLLDLDIGGQDGLSQLRFLDAARYRRALVFMSGYDRRVLSHAERVGRDLGLNVIASVAKPFRADEFMALLKDLAARCAASTE